MMKDYTVSDLTRLLQVLSDMKESGVQVNKEINAVLATLMESFGIESAVNQSKTSKDIKTESNAQRYAHIAYADKANGEGFSLTPGNKPYVGLINNSTSPIESTDLADYSWSLIKQ